LNEDGNTPKSARTAKNAGGSSGGTPSKIHKVSSSRIGTKGRGRNKAAKEESEGEEADHKFDMKSDVADDEFADGI
jgi:hypothetical protein